MVILAQNSSFQTGFASYLPGKIKKKNKKKPDLPTQRFLIELSRVNSGDFTLKQ